ncbi:ABC transporter permease [Cuneatibacter sp. NSJ-177]|uniref:ABC transporter permease n=1 Tax=Cuneatibacter sp. NSJ-177 TaxID=2931401 RepID=UPI001FD02872|nr:ABC transporter permease [Cuneatibacter sp. NSJ-177]MCJ7836218.1 ABC transporter permease [Cuneatibacter sp. NSJ-177]
MKNFIIKRILLGVVVLLGVVAITFVVTRVIPSNPALQWVGSRATAEQIAAAEEELGLNKPIPVQLGIYLNDMLHGDLGYSLKSHRPVVDEIMENLPPTLELVLLGTIFAIVAGMALGVLTASHKNKWQDHLGRFFSVGSVSLPTFWVALLLQLLFYGVLKLLPIGGRLSMDAQLFGQVPDVTGFLLLDCLLTGNFSVFGDALSHLILPCITLALYPTGMVARMTRSALLEILNEDYIKAAQSYGIKRKIILWKYALKNSLGPTVTVVTLSVGYTLVNTFLVESVFNWPGLGSYISDAVMNMDYPAIMGVTLFSACAYVVLNMIADIVVALDPRVRI